MPILKRLAEQFRQRVIQNPMFRVWIPHLAIRCDLNNRTHKLHFRFRKDQDFSTFLQQEKRSSQIDTKENSQVLSL